QRLPGFQRRRLGADCRGRARALAGVDRPPPGRHPDPAVGRGHGGGGRAVVDRTRALPVPDGLDGSRLDVAISRLFGLSRSAAAELVETGEARVDGSPRSKSDRVPAGAWLEVTLPPPPVPAAPPPEPVAGLRVLYDDEDIVVVDKPAGVATHPSPGWTGPTVVGGLAAAGYTIA